MSEPKPFASLSSGLLARKGAARPAMRPQGFGQAGASLEDLGWNDMGFEPPKATAAPRDADHDAFGEDIEDQPRTHRTGLTPVQSPVHVQQTELSDRLGVEEEALEDQNEAAEPIELVSAPVAVLPVAAPAPVPASTAVEASTAVPAPRPVTVLPVPAPDARRAARPRSAPGSKAKAAFTLRLEPARHLKLRLACAVNGRSAQQLVTDALDQLLDSMPELDAMAEKAKRKG